MTLSDPISLCIGATVMYLYMKIVTLCSASFTVYDNAEHTQPNRIALGMFIAPTDTHLMVIYMFFVLFFFFVLRELWSDGTDIYAGVRDSCRPGQVYVPRIALQWLNTYRY